MCWSWKARAFAFAKVYRSRTHRPDWLKSKEVAQFCNSGWLTIPLTFTSGSQLKVGSARARNRGNGKARVELRQGLAAITRYVTAHQLPPARALLRLDGLYGTGAVLSDVAGFAFVTRGKEYSVLDHPLGRGTSALAP